jgi:hypothetical protein
VLEGCSHCVHIEKDSESLERMCTRWFLKPMIRYLTLVLRTAEGVDDGLELGLFESDG